MSHSVSLRALHLVRIDVQRCRRTGVPQQRGDRAHIDTRSNQPRPRRVAHGVHAETQGAGSLSDPADRVRDRLRTTACRPCGGGEHESLIVVFTTGRRTACLWPAGRALRSQSLERRDRRVRSARPARSWWPCTTFASALGRCAADRRSPLVDVHIRPLKARLARRAAVGSRRRRRLRGPWRVFCRFQRSTERLRLVRKALAALWRPLWRLYGVSHVAERHLEFDGPPQHRCRLARACAGSIEQDSAPRPPDQPSRARSV